MKSIGFITMIKIMISYCICLSMLLSLTCCSYGVHHSMKNEPLKRAMFPPSDLYDVVFEKKIEIVKEGYEDSVTFKLEYPGLYSIGVFFDKFPVKYDKQSYKDLSLRLKIDFFDGDKFIFGQKTGEPILHFASKEGCGLWLARFYSPDQIPLGKNIQCKIEVLNPDAFFAKQYGEARLFIKKASEK